MSFNVNTSFNKDLETNNSTADDASASYQDFPEFNELTRSINNTLYLINNHQLTNIKSLLTKYQEIKDDQNQKDYNHKLNGLSSKLTEVITKTTKHFKDINRATNQLNDFLIKCETNHEDEDTIKYLRHKESIFLNLVKTSINQFNQLQKKFENLQRDYIDEQSRNVNDRANAQHLKGADTHETEHSAADNQGYQEQVHIDYESVNAEELEQQTLLIEEREREIHQISQDISDINDIFSNLSGIVGEQQYAIDNIEDNILRYNNDVFGASNELRRAERYQKRSGGRMFCCLIILLIVLGSIVLVGVIF
ncbi:Piso0_000906 [Millerozyma farinosa CBS 7064]|uniref:Piso0_000906 protein n=1 Tax=Pichia sorbitophila (strain ATCC MYA-4447 / BCRC 22081 / CBS 7064 / NBRC 10061 / NRRL Y-12695) TaxID=559304 RepID=G8YQD7_PICSO|nr:Piso0_000906 [Millerozyma farinosa CBS 7064]